MHRFYVAARSLAFMAAMLVACSTIDAAETKQVGMVISLKGVANVQHADGRAERLKLTSPIFEKDTITTEFQSFVQIDFLDHSKVSVMGSSDLTIDEYVYDGTKRSASRVSIQNGALGFMAGKIKEVAPENYQVKTAFASVGIRGSSGELTTSDGSLPGVPPGLSLMKTGGEGLTVAASVPEMAPVGDITQSGAGITVNSSSEVKTVTFAAPPTQTYTATTEKKVSEGRQEVAKQEAAKPAQTAQGGGQQKPAGEAGKAAAQNSQGKAAPAGDQKKTAAPEGQKKEGAAAASQASAKAEPAPKNEQQASTSDAPAVVPAQAPATPDQPPVEAPAEVNEPPPVIEVDNDDLSIAEVTQEIQQENQEIQEEVTPPVIPDPEPESDFAEDETEFESEDEYLVESEGEFESDDEESWKFESEFESDSEFSSGYESDFESEDEESWKFQSEFESDSEYSSDFESDFDSEGDSNSFPDHFLADDAMRDFWCSEPGSRYCQEPAESRHEDFDPYCDSHHNPMPPRDETEFEEGPYEWGKDEGPYEYSEHEGPYEHFEFEEFAEAPFEWEFEHEGMGDELDGFEDIVNEAVEDVELHKDFLDVDASYNLFCDGFYDEGEEADCYIPDHDAVDLWCQEPEDDRYCSEVAG